FTVHLPAVRTSPQPAATDMPQATVRTSVESVLVVEDEAGLRQLVSTVLSEGGYHVLTADSAAEALALTAGNPRPLDLLLTDLRLSGLQGSELANELRKRYAGLKVIFMTGDPSQTNLGENDELLVKPFTPADLLRKVREVLDSPHRHAFGL